MKKSGILLIAHGSRDITWVTYIEDAVRGLSLEQPMEISFLELVPGRSIAEGIMRLEEVGVRKIIVIPMFMTMGSTHLDEIQYMLGIRLKPTVETDLTPIPHSSKIVWCSPLEDDRIVKEILAERITCLSRSPIDEWLLLIGHGSEVQGFGEKWESLLQRLCHSLKSKFGFKGASYATLHPDTIRSTSLELMKGNRVITVPVFLSEGYFTQSLIPRKLVGNIYDGKTLLPHPLITVWIQEKMRKALTDSRNYYTL
ncbi:MAG TPA: CbiX/SirB N-terminal domain-containing protein [Bacillota bacterium]|nr:CbiX/SirB N-terminal domain-containing protein [Bacillota bacterium]